jgi:hypothetical protein
VFNRPLTFNKNTEDKVMKLILNGKENEVIKIDNFSRNLDIPDPSVEFNIYFSTENVLNIQSMNYVAQYANQGITSYEILSDEDDVLLSV